MLGKVMIESMATISEDEYASAMSLHGRFSSKIKGIYFLAASGLVLSAVVGSGNTRLIAACALIGGVVGHFVMTRLLNPWRARRSYGKYPLIQRPFLIESESTGVYFKSEDGEMRLKWGDIHKWRESSELVLIYPAPNLFHIVPKRLAEVGLDIALLTSSLEKHVGIAT